jgi:hypothetical protein
VIIALLNNSTFEVALTLIVAGGIIAATSVALTLRNSSRTRGGRRVISPSTTTKSMQESGKPDAKEVIPDIPTAELTLNSTETTSPEIIQTFQGEESSGSSPISASFEIAPVNTFQAPTLEEKDTVASVEATTSISTDNAQNLAPNPADNVNQGEEKTQFAKVEAVPSIPLAATNESINQQENPPTPSAQSLPIPTDNSALDNLIPAPFPIGVQNSVPGTLNAGGSPSYGNAPSAYCVKCKSKKQIRDPSGVTMKNGKAAISGFCCDCGTKVFRIGRFPSSSSSPSS